MIMIRGHRSSRRQVGITLIELLVSMAIMGIITTMILGTWFALSNSYFQTSRSTEQIDSARQGISRMAREIRDAQGVLGAGVPAPFVTTSSDEIRFYSTFNMVNADTPGTSTTPPSSQPRLTRFIYRVTDSSQGIGSIYMEYAGPNGFETGPYISTVLVSGVANARANRDVFVYSAYDPTTGALYYSSSHPTPAVTVAPSDLVSVGINVLVDLNPGKSPNYTDVSTTVNPRNIRQL